MTGVQTCALPIYGMFVPSALCSEAVWSTGCLCSVSVWSMGCLCLVLCAQWQCGPRDVCAQCFVLSGSVVHGMFVPSALCSVLCAHCSVAKVWSMGCCSHCFGSRQCGPRNVVLIALCVVAKMWSMGCNAYCSVVKMLSIWRHTQCSVVLNLVCTFLCLSVIAV